MASVLALMLAMAVGVTQAHAQSYVSEATLKERQESATDQDLWTNGDYWRDQKKWLRTWIRVRKSFDWLPAEAIGKGKEVRPRAHKVVVLDPPLPTSTPPGTVLHRERPESGNAHRLAPRKGVRDGAEHCVDRSLRVPLQDRGRVHHVGGDVQLLHLRVLHSHVSHRPDHNGPSTAPDAHVYGLPS